MMFDLISASELIEKKRDQGLIQAVGWHGRPNSPKIRVACVHNITLCPHGLAVAEEKTALLDSMFYLFNLESIYEELQRYYIQGGSIQRLRGDYVCLFGTWCDGFWHWIIEYMQRALIAENAGFKGDYLISAKAPRFVEESLQMIGISQERLLSFDIQKPVKVEKLWLPEKPSVRYSEKHLFTLCMLRNRILSKVEIRRSRSRVYISRKNARNFRRIVNESELLDLLLPYRFEEVIMESLSFKKQIELMASADWLIGGSGAGIVHGLFMPLRSNIVELFSPKYINPCTLDVFKMLLHEYTMIPGYNNRNYRWGEDIEAHLPVLKYHLERRFGNIQAYDCTAILSGIRKS
jgi:capsular polysaccharide biosynthesis protein